MSRMVRYKKKINKKIYSSKARGDVAKEADGVEDQERKMVMNPTAAGANCEPRTSPHVAAMIAGILQAERPYKIAEMVNPGGDGQMTKRPKATV